MPGNSERSSLRDIIIWGKQHDAFESKLGQSLLRLWRVGAADESIEKMIRNQVRPLQTREEFGELTPFRMPRSREGEILLGRDDRGSEIRVPLRVFTEGLLIASNTGGGKSNLLSFLLLQIAATRRTRVWVSEMYKTQHRHLRPLFQRFRKDLVVLRATDWKFNPLQAGTSNPIAHIAVAIDLLVRTLDLPSRAGSILRNTIHDLYRAYGILEGRVEAWPCLFDVYESVRSTAGLNAAARDAILDRLGSLLNMLTPQCAAWRLAWNPSDLARYSIDFEMKGTSEHVKQILLESSLYALFQHEIERGVVNGPLSLFVAFEDSQRFFADQQRGDSALTPMDEIAGITRGTGIGLCVNVQTAQGLSRKLVPNLATRIIGRLGSYDDYSRLGADMALNREQLSWAMHNLRPGRFLAQLSSGRWRHPFVMSVPLVEIPTTVSDAEAARSVEILDRLPTVAAPEYANWPGRPPKVSSPTDSQDSWRINSEAQRDGSVGSLEDSRPEIRISKRCLDYLSSIAEDPLRSITAMDEDLGLGSAQGDKIRKQLLSAGLVEKIRINLLGRGRQFHLMELTLQGHSLLKSIGVEIIRGHGRGGLAHCYWTNSIAECMTSKGATCVIEDESKAVRVDIAIRTSQGIEVAVEVECSAGHEVHNVRKDLAAGFKHVVSLVKEKPRVITVREKLALELGTAALEFVYVGELRDFENVLGLHFLEMEKSSDG